MIKIIIVFITLLTSCASTKSAWSPWTYEGVSQNKMVWRFCSERLDGPDYHHKGLCYQAQECRTRKFLFGTKKECRVKVLLCSWGDIECMSKYNLMDRIIINRGGIR